MARFAGRLFDLLSQLHDELIQRPRGPVVINAPHFIEDAFAGDGFTDFTEKNCEDAQFARRQLESVPATVAA